MHHTDIHSVIKKEEKDYITVEEFHEEMFGDRPKWSVFLSGLRCRENLTQKQLGDMINTSPKNISSMEHGRRIIGKKVALRLAKVFDVDYRIFL